MKQLNITILRGLPGSGKSTFIRNNYPNAVVVSADHFFYKLGKGRYQFDPTRIIRAHAECQLAFCRYLQEYRPHIVVDNTHVTKDEMLFYQEIPTTLGINSRVNVIDLFDNMLSDSQLAARNTHDVPEMVIARMRERYER